MSQTGMAFDPQTGDSFQLNDSGKKIIILMQEGLSIPDISRKISEFFKISYDHAITDVLEFQVQLNIIGLMK